MLVRSETWTLDLWHGSLTSTTWANQARFFRTVTMDIYKLTCLQLLCLLKFGSSRHSILSRKANQAKLAKIREEDGHFLPNLLNYINLIFYQGMRTVQWQSSYQLDHPILWMTIKWHLIKFFSSFQDERLSRHKSAAFQDKPTGYKKKKNTNIIY